MAKRSSGISNEGIVTIAAIGGAAIILGFIGMKAIQAGGRAQAHRYRSNYARRGGAIYSRFGENYQTFPRGGTVGNYHPNTILASNAYEYMAGPYTPSNTGYF